MIGLEWCRRSKFSLRNAEYMRLSSCSDFLLFDLHQLFFWCSVYHLPFSYFKEDIIFRCLGCHVSNFPNLRPLIRLVIKTLWPELIHNSICLKFQKLIKSITYMTHIRLFGFDLYLPFIYMIKTSQELNYSCLLLWTPEIYLFTWLQNDDDKQALNLERSENDMSPFWIESLN